MTDVDLLRLRKRAEFLRLRHGARINTRAFVLQAAPNGTSAIRFGVTATKKLGRAVIRNRAKRRLRALAAEVLPSEGRVGMDYVFIARPPILSRRFDRLLDDLRAALVDPRHP